MTDKLKDKLHEKAEQEVEVRGHKMEKVDIFKFVGLIAFFAIMVLIVVLLVKPSGLLGKYVPEKV